MNMLQYFISSKPMSTASGSPGAAIPCTSSSRAKSPNAGCSSTMKKHSTNSGVHSLASQPPEQDHAQKQAHEGDDGQRPADTKEIAEPIVSRTDHQDVHWVSHWGEKRR